MRKRIKIDLAAKARSRPTRKLPKVVWRDMKRIYAVLAERYDSGDPTISARHNEHQQ